MDHNYEQLFSWAIGALVLLRCPIEETETRLAIITGQPLSTSSPFDQMSVDSENAMNEFSKLMDEIHGSRKSRIVSR